MQEVHLPEIRLSRVATHSRPVLHGPAEMSVSFDAQPGQESDTGNDILNEPVLRTQAYRFDQHFYFLGVTLKMLMVAGSLIPFFWDITASVLSAL